MSAGGRRVRDEEAALWRNVARDVTPLPRHAERPEDDGPDDCRPGEEPPVPARKAKPRKAPARPAPPGPPRQAVPLPDLDPALPAGLDRRTARRLRRGQLAAEARLDLHGKTQAQAHAALQGFIKESRMARRRCVVVITGKGSVASGEGGVLRRMAPRWLNEPALRRHIIAITNAPESSGGAGALYVLLRSREPGEPDRGAG